MAQARMWNKNEKITYFLYARKSSENEDRQVQSIDDQVRLLIELTHKLGFKVKEVITESKSAKKPHIRPLFEDMMKRIEKGEADGILCWHLNRLSRNPIDSGRICWLLQQGIIKSIQTMERQYLPEDNVLLFNVESGMANQYIIELRKNVKRGMENKCQKGWLPCTPPVGYLNSEGEKAIIKDSERFDLVRKMWGLMLTGSYTPPQILDIANSEWGFKTRKFKKKGGKELSRSGIYKIFSNLFYAGIISFAENQYEGKHDRMITLEEYGRVQILLGRKGKPRMQKHKFAFTGMIRCGECGCLVTAEVKKKLIKSTNTIKEYTYYHCTRKTLKVNCSQRKVLRSEDLEKQVLKKLKEFSILPELRDLALEGLEKNTNFMDYRKIQESQQKALEHTQKELNELTKMRYRQLIDDETFIKGRNSLIIKTTSLKGKLSATEAESGDVMELCKKAFNFATHAYNVSIRGGLELKREILSCLAKSLILQGNILNIKPYEWLLILKNGHTALEEEYGKLELKKILMEPRQSKAFIVLCLQWWNTVNAIRTSIKKDCKNIQFPDIPPKLLRLKERKNNHKVNI
jgi:DNA invertase Pin-like site-specific DNA recombinase